MILMLEIASSYPIDTQVSRVGRGFFGDANALQPTSGPPGSPPWKDHPLHTTSQWVNLSEHRRVNLSERHRFVAFVAFCNVSLSVRSSLPDLTPS